MYFGSGRPDQIEIWVSGLNYRASCRYLGIHLDKSLLFREHIDYVVRKLNTISGLTYRVRHIYPRKCPLMFYNFLASFRVHISAAKHNMQPYKNI